MKAVRHASYGSPDDLRIENVEKPVPHDKQVLIKVYASSINASDWRGLRGTPIPLRLMSGGILRPKDPRMGSDVVGVVEAVGESVTQFQPGDVVLGCAKGSFAEYVLAREAYVTRKPDQVTIDQAAALPVAGLTALQMIRAAGGIQPGQKVVIQGASGGVGMFGVQLAKLNGAEVTAVCSARNAELARSLGADQVIDYRREDFTRNHNCYDRIFGVNGYHSIYSYRRSLKPNGTYICAGGELGQIFQAILLGPRLSKDGKKLAFQGIAAVVQEDLQTLADLLAEGKIKAIIDRTYSLEEISTAMGYIEQQHAQGKVVIRVEEPQ